MKPLSAYVSSTGAIKVKSFLLQIMESLSRTANKVHRLQRVFGIKTEMLLNICPDFFRKWKIRAEKKSAIHENMHVSRHV
jgi:hypothetical protein